MSTVTDLERKVQSLQDKLGQAKDSLYKARLDEWHLVPNETVVLYNGEEYRFVMAEFIGLSGKPWLRANKKLKDGTWGEQFKRLYSEWELKP